MANPTTNYSFAMPTNTDLVKDLPADFDIFGQAVDDRIKALNPETTLGDIAYRSATANVKTRLALGTANQQLRVNSGATAPEWFTPAPAGAMTLINTGGTTLTGATVTISSIPATYKNLQLIIRNYKPATDGQYCMIRFNGDSGANRHTNSNTYGNLLNSTFNDTAASIGQEQDNGTDDGLLCVDIFDYANTTTWKIGNTLSINNNKTTTTNLNVYTGSIFYNQTAAISSIDLLNGSGNFTSGTAYLYGVS
jgi:hypothetical protein